MTVTCIHTDSYGFVPSNLYRTLKSHNVPPALFDELLDYFGDSAWPEMLAYVKSVGKSKLNHGQVYRDRP